MISTSARLRIGVHQGSDQAWHGVQKAVLRLDGRLMSLHGGPVGLHDDLALGAQLMAGPPQPDMADAEHAGRSPTRTAGDVKPSAVMNQAVEG